MYRQAIHEAAIRVFGQTGFRDAKMADIAADAGVATGTLYNYFSSKEDIFESILEDGRERLRAEVEDKTAIADPLARLREIVRVMLGFLEEHGAMFMIYMQLGAHPLLLERSGTCDHAFRSSMTAIIERALHDASGRLRPDLSPEVLASAVGGLLNGTILRWVDEGCPEGLTAQADTLMDLFLHGATPR